MIATSTPLTPGRRPTASRILPAQEAQSIPVTRHSCTAPLVSFVISLSRPGALVLNDSGT
jgi:hypothetical protein